MQSLYLYASISQSSVCTLSVFPHSPSPLPWAGHEGWSSQTSWLALNSKEIDVIAFVLNPTLNFIQQIPSQPRNNNLTNMYMYISIDHTGDRMWDQNGLDKRVNPPVETGSNSDKAAERRPLVLAPQLGVSYSKGMVSRFTNWLALPSRSIISLASCFTTVF